MSHFKEFYTNEVVPKLNEKFNYSNPMQVPKLEKIVLNMGVGEAINNIKLLDKLKSDIDKTYLYTKSDNGFFARKNINLTSIAGVVLI